MARVSEEDLQVDIDKVWDQSTYRGRLRYFFRVTNPSLLLKSKEEYAKAKHLVEQSRLLAASLLHGNKSLLLIILLGCIEFQKELLYKN